MKKTKRGFTLVELLVTMALVGIAASVVLPLASIVETRAKEAELRRSLRTIREALDKYKAAADSGLIEKKTGASGYPPNLEVLVSGTQASTLFGMGTPPLIFLRSIPRDPFFEDKTVPAAQTWAIRSYGQRAPQGGGADVFDVSSTSPKTALDGSRLSEW